MLSNITAEEAYNLIMESVYLTGVKELSILATLGLSCAEEIVSKEHIPPFTNSAMDGFAVKAEDTVNASENNPVTLQILDEIRAGDVAENPIQAGQCCYITTGAPMPEGADAVVMVEYTRREGTSVEIFKSVKHQDNVRLAGEDVKPGDVVIKPHTVFRPQEIACLASLGIQKAPVFARPSVGILSTGNELVSYKEPLIPGKIRDSNSIVLASLVEKYGGIPFIIPTALDTIENLGECFEKAMDLDILVTSGGVSMGDSDLVLEVFQECGLELIFHKVKQKPGFPLAFGKADRLLFFGLPGNPVSVYVNFILYVRPAMLKMMGYHHTELLTVEATLTEDKRKKLGRQEYVRAIVEQRDGQYFATTTGYQGSGVITSLTKANALLVLPMEMKNPKAGTKVKAILLDWKYDGI